MTRDEHRRTALDTARTLWRDAQASSGLHNAEVAHRVGCSLGYVEFIRNGARAPRIALLADALYAMGYRLEIRAIKSNHDDT